MYLCSRWEYRGGEDFEFCLNLIEYLRYNLEDLLNGNIVVVRAVPVAPAEVEAELVIMTMMIYIL